MKSDIGVLIAFDAAVGQEMVDAVLGIEPAVQILSVAESLEARVDRTAHDTADLLVIACDGYSDRVVSFIEASVKAWPERPVVVLSQGPVNGLVRRAFEAGADDIVALPPASQNGAATEQILFTIQKAIARRRGPGTSPRSARGSMICVLGPKGGIGKTLTATNLAVELATEGHSVALVDLDLQFGDAALALGIAPQKTIYDLVTSSGSVDEDKLQAYMARHESGMQLLLAPMRPDQAGAITVEFLRELYALMRRTYDYVVVDTPPGFTPEVIASIDSSSHVCMVGMLDSLSLKNTRLGLETLGLMGYDERRVKLVLNRADSRVGITRDDVLEIVGRVPDVMVPSHRDIARHVNAGKAIVTSSRRSEAAKAFISLARLYADQPADRTAGGKRSLLGRRR